MKRKGIIRPCIEELEAYVPGEQPRVKGLVKLNTNENPYPPSPRVEKAIRRQLDARLRLYPSPNSDRFREKIAEVHRFRLDQVIAGNGSDDILTMALRAFAGEGDWVQFPQPTYSLYPVLTRMQDARIHRVPFGDGYRLELKKFRRDAALTLVASPNAPSGTGIPTDFLRQLARWVKGVLLIDEAYADFAGHHAFSLARNEKNVLVSRTFSKSYSLAGMRLGFAVGAPRLIGAMFKVKDSYNLDRLAQAAGEAALADPAHLRRNVRRVIQTREWLTGKLEERGWSVLPSEANFVFARPPVRKAAWWLGKLREQKILVRWFSMKETRDRLRITVGTDREMRLFLRAVDRIMQKKLK